MLARYKIYRGRRPENDPLPDGVRQDTRKHTRHPLRPTPEMVEAYLASPSERAWQTLRADYLRVLNDRFKQDRVPFDELADLAAVKTVFLGCNCPTQANPDVAQCHTVLALRFMKEKYPKLRVELP